MLSLFSVSSIVHAIAIHQQELWMLDCTAKAHPVFSTVLFESSCNLLVSVHSLQEGAKVGLQVG